jgi:hypothetical protein
MSYDIFLACVRGKDSPRFSREVFEEIFLPHCPYLTSYRADPGFMQVEYPDGSRADISIHNTSDEEEQARRQARTPEERIALPKFPPGDPAYIEFLGFGHFGGDAFFQDLYALADRVGAMVYAGGAVIVTKESVLKEIPEDFLGMENARVVRDPAELEDAVFAGGEL